MAKLICFWGSNVYRAFDLVPQLLEEIDHYFHHGSVDGNLFVAPANFEEFKKFYDKYYKELNWCSKEKNEELLLHLDYETRFHSEFNVYYYYFDDNDCDSSLYRYTNKRDSFGNPWEIICGWSIH